MATMTNDVETTPNTPPRAGARWGQERRLEFIDYRLHWDGHLNRSDLTSFFGISVPQSSLDLAEYIKRAPGNLTYDTSTKVYRAPSSFQALFASSSLERYLEDLLRATEAPKAYMAVFSDGIHPWPLSLALGGAWMSRRSLPWSKPSASTKL